MASRPVQLAGERTALGGIGPLFPIVFSGYLALGLPLPVLALQVHERLGFGAATVGWVIGIQALATVLTRQLAGRVADTRGPKAGTIIGLPLAVLAGVAYLASDRFAAYPHASLAVLLVGRLLLGPAESLYLTGTMAWGIARIGPARTARVMAWQGIGIYGALAVGAPLGLAVMARFGFSGVALATIVIPLVGLAIAVALPPEPGVAGERVPFWRVVGLVWRQGVGLLLAGVPFAGLSAFASLYYADRGWSGAGFALAGFGLGYVAMRVFFAHWPERYGGRRVTVGCLLVEVLGQALLFAAADPAMALIGATLTGLGLSLVFPALGVDVVKRVPPQSRATAIGAFVAFLDLSSAVTGPLAGLLADRAGYAAVFLAGALACGLGFLTLIDRSPARAGSRG